MITKCTLNNRSMRGIRQSQVYQGLIIDLKMLGVIGEDEAELLIGGSIPKGIRLPDGSEGVTANDETGTESDN